MSALEFAKWASAPPSWLMGAFDDQDVFVLSNRIRLARNLKGHLFPHRSTTNRQAAVLSTISDTTARKNLFPSSIFVRLCDLTALEREFLMERHLISPTHAHEQGEKGLLVSAGERMSLMVNEEDHLRLAAFGPGLGLQETLETMMSLEKTLAHHLSFAFDDEFGYLTACPTNMGTGLRASALVHLPALSWNGRMNEIIPQLKESGILVRGFYGEGTVAWGDIFQISNATTFGQTESLFAKNVEKAVRSLVEWERKETDWIRQGPLKLPIEDRIYRALGTLKTARLLGINETMQNLSAIRFGIRMNLSLGLGLSDINELWFKIQPGHLTLLQNGDTQLKEPLDSVRAAVMRQRLN